MAGMRYGVLGTLEVVTGDVQLRVGGPRQEKLLAVCLLEADRVIPFSRLVEALWDREPPRTAKTQVHKAVLELRRRLGSDVLVSHPAGYRLHLVDAELDVEESTRLVERADAAAAEGLLTDAVAVAGEALRLWRGPALAGLSGQVVRAAAQLLDEQRLALLGRSLGWELDLGRAAEVVPRLADLVSRHPLREWFRGQLMLALLRSGRQADALAVFDEGRRVLAEELGLDPGPELVAIHGQVLAGTDTLPSLPAPSTSARWVPRTLPYDVPDFTGRPDECRRLLALDVDTRTVVISAIEGMAGVGKTALAVHTAHRLADRYPDGQLFIDLHGFTPGRDPASPVDALETLLRATGVPGDRIPFTLDERVALWRTTLAGRRVLLVFDNAADAAQVRPLLPGGAGNLVLVTSRRRLSGLAGATSITLDALPEDDAIALVMSILGAERVTAEQDAVATLVARCGHLPLAIRIAATRLQRRPLWTVQRMADRLDTERRRLAELSIDADLDVNVALMSSYRAIPADQQRLFRLVGLHPGADLDVSAAAALAGLDLEHTEHLLEQLVDEHLLHEPRAGRYACHDLLRAHARDRAAAEDDEQVRQSALTRLFDHYLQVAAHAADLLDPHNRLRRPHVERPPEIFAVLLGQEDGAREWLDRELPNLLASGTNPGWPGHSRDLSATLAFHLEDQARHRDARALHTAALTASRSIGDRVGEARALRNLGRVHLYVGELASAHERFTAALALLDDGSPDALIAMNDVGITLSESGRYAEAIATCLRAVELCERTGDEVALARLLTTIGNANSHLGEYGAAEERLLAAVRIAQRIGRRGTEPKIHLNLGDLYTRMRVYDRAIDHLNRALVLFRGQGNHEGAAMARMNIGCVLTQMGHHEEANEHLVATFGFFQATGNRRWQSAALKLLGSLYTATGQHEKALRFLRSALELARQIGTPFAVTEIANRLGEATCRNGDPEQARHHHAEALRISRDSGQRHDQAQAHHGLGNAYRALGDLSQARAQWTHAFKLYSALGLPEAAELENLLAMSDC